MKVQVEELSPIERKLSIEVEQSRVADELTRAYATLSRQVKVAGFRPGKVPRRILEQRYKAQVEDDVIQRVVERAYFEAIKEHQVEAVGSPKVTNERIKPDAPFAFEARVEVKPKVLAKDYRALALIYTGGQPIFGLPDSFRALTNGTIGGVPNPVVIVAALAIIAWIILHKTSLGEYFVAVGGNPEAARIAGVPVTLTEPSAYMISGFMAAVAALILVGRLGAAEPTMGTLWELDAIAASAIGGAPLMGGIGSIPGTLIGCIILGTLRNGLTLLNVQAFYQLLATGIIIVAILIDKFASGAGGK